jgi:proteasome lid subunit RPN8/RPN11
MAAMKATCIEIASALVRSVTDHARLTYPDEACGLLFGSAERVTRIQRVGNVAPDPRNSFEIDPAELLRAQREGRGQGDLLLGWYHSHPGGSPLPSARDARAAHEPGRLWMIVAPPGGVRLFMSRPGGPILETFEAINLRIVD